MVLPIVQRLANQPLHLLFSCSTRFMSSQCKVSEQKLDETAKKLETVVKQFKNFSPGSGLFSPDIELVDEIINKNVRGLINYQLHCMKYTIYINWTYNGYNFSPVNVTKYPDKGIVDIKWQFYGKPGWYLTFVVDLFNSYNKSQEEKKDEWDAFEGLMRFEVNETGTVSKQTLKILRSGNYRNIIRLSKKSGPDNPML